MTVVREMIGIVNPPAGVEAGSRSGPFIAVDWGTTNRRVYRLNGEGQVQETTRDDRGVLAVPHDTFPSELHKIRERFGDLPVLCAGMVGSTRGWVEAPYVACPVSLDGLAAGVHWVDGRTGIVPGAVWDANDRCDVMRGEEVQFLGAVAGGLAPDSGLLCQPGTHCKWAEIKAGVITSFATSMTGELFSLTQKHSLLSSQMIGEAEIDASFHRGLADSRDDRLLVHLFSARADQVAGRHRIASVASYISGLLIGYDVRTSPHAEAAAIHVLADPKLGALYGAAILAGGGNFELIDSHAAFVAGVTALWERLK